MGCVCQIVEVRAIAPIGFRGQFLCTIHHRIVLPTVDNEKIVCCGYCAGEQQVTIKSKIAKLLSQIWLTAIKQNGNYSISSILYDEITELLTNLRLEGKKEGT